VGKNQEDFLNMNYMMADHTFLQGQEWRMKFLQQQKIQFDIAHGEDFLNSILVLLEYVII
jgi:hypothetical protein